MLWILVFCSGFAGLVYEVLWMKQLGLLFGSTSQAAGAVLAAFFGGMAAGSWFWGRRSVRSANALRVYAGLEAGVAVTALLYFVILRLFYAVYPWFYQGIASSAWLLAVKFALALLLVFPPAFCMGGTIPVLGQFLVPGPAAPVRRKPTARGGRPGAGGFGATAALLYGINTLGAALGAFLAGFYLPLWLGFRATCLGAIAVSAAVSAGAYALSREPMPGRKPKSRERQPGLADPGFSAFRIPHSAFQRSAVLLVCFLSGFGFLALEVLWTRMFAQVLENSVYTFAAILVIVLLCLAAGALVSARLARRASSPFRVLAILSVASGLAVAAAPFVFMRLTHGMQILASRGSWSSYVGLIFRNGFLTIGPPALLLGTVFPFLMKTEERFLVSAGRSLGLLAAVNTVGAILGSLLCGFVLLETLHLWRTVQLVAVLYLAAALLLPVAWKAGGRIVKTAGGVGLALVFTILNPAGLPVNSEDPLREHEEILKTWQGSDCTVAVARGSGGLSIKINSHYGLGSTGAYRLQQLQADIPLRVYPRTRSIFFLGLGTGITAGSALDPQYRNVTRVVACELVPEVITAAKEYMTDVDGRDYTEGLFNDPRVTVLAEDGRYYLMAARERFDLVDADLFVPFRSGVGSLYSREHFERVKERLEPGGVFFQWLPLYQVTEYEFSVIARTMLEVFDQVSLWENNYQPGGEVVALVGHRDATPLAACAVRDLEARKTAVAGKGYRDLSRLLLPFDSQSVLFFYCGNLTKSRDLFAGYPVNTDDKPVIEYMAPRTYRSMRDTAIPWFVGPRMARLVDKIQRRCPPAEDPLLANRTPADRLLPTAGAAYHWARIWELIGDENECRKAWEQFVAAWTNEGERGTRNPGQR